MQSTLKDRFQNVIDELRAVSLSFYDDRLVTIAVFGSVARGTMRPDSDLDLLLVVKELPHGRMARVREFDQGVEAVIEDTLAKVDFDGVPTRLSAIFKTPEEVECGSTLFLDMTDQAIIIFDKDDFFHHYLDKLRNKLKAMGAKRIQKGGGYYWMLKPDRHPDEDIFL